MFLGTDIQFLCDAAMLRADLQEEHSAAQRQDPAGEGAALVPVQDSGVVRDGDTYYLVINNLGEQCLRRTFHAFPLVVTGIWLIRYRV